MVFANTTRLPAVQKRKVISLFLIILTLLLAIVTFEYFYREYLEKHWKVIALQKEQDVTNLVQAKFIAYEEESFNVVERLGNAPTLQKELWKYPETSPTGLFELLSSEPSSEFSFELYNKEKQTISWAGNRGPRIDSLELQLQKKAYILQGPIYTYFIVSSPIYFHQTLVGFIGGKRLFDVNYPLNNRFINNKAFSSTFTSTLDFINRFQFTTDPKSRHDTNTYSIALIALDGGSIGFVYVPRLTRSAIVDYFNDTIARIKNLLIFLLIAVIFFWGAVWSFSVNSQLLRLTIWTIALWGLRYVFVLTNFPLSIIQIDIFEPKYFASPFGFGVAESLGDLGISSLFLFMNILLWSRYFHLKLNSLPKSVLPTGIGRKISNVSFIALLTVILLLVIRGFAATIRSAVFDSALAYNDPASVIPSFELSVMLVSLLLISISLLFVSVGIILLIMQLLNSIFGNTRSIITPYLALIMILALASILFGILQQNSLMSQEDRLIILFFLVGISIWIIRSQVHPFSSSAVKIIIIFGLVGFLLLIPLLDRDVHELDRLHIEVLANEIVRPQDNWLTFILNKSLYELSNDESRLILTTGDDYDIEKLAFTQWAKSTLGKEGFNCNITYVNPVGKIVSNFHIGVVTSNSRNGYIDISSLEKTVHIEERNQSDVTTKWYVGYTPITNENNDTIGCVLAEITGGKQTILRTEAPAILRSYGKEKFETHYRALALSEYYHNKLTYTTNETYPIERLLPTAVQNIDSLEDEVWLDDVIDGKPYETFFFREHNNTSKDFWFALSMEKLDFKWHFYSYFRYFLLYLFFGAIVLCFVILAKIFSSKRITPTFRLRLTAAFVVVSIIPVVILAYYNREYAIENTETAAVKELSNQTSVVVAEILRRYRINVPVALAQLSDEQCANVANDLNTDFNVYFGSTIQASSKPEMFTAEITDQCLTSDAFLNVVLRKKEFFSEHQIIGNLPYVVGYRPVIAENGSIVGVVSVSTIYRQTEIDEELMRRNVFLYLAYALALVFSIIIGTVLANRISSPIRRLKDATKMIAAGQFEVNLRSHRNDELGELEKSFVQMSNDLKATQEQIIRTQREVAWKQMAQQVAHEIKNPLTPMKLSVQHLQQAYKDGVKDFSNVLKRVSTTILDQIEALSRIASEFSSFARMPARKLEKLDVHNILKESASLFQQHKKIKFDLNLEASTPYVEADREELRRAFINIIRNAIQAMEEQGRILILTKSVNGFFEIRIVDSGHGIPKEIMGRLFEPNFSTKTDGMGLGLSIVNKTVDDFGGTITVESEIGKGTTVIIRFPLRADADNSNL